MSSTGQLSVVTFVFQEDSCVLVKLFPLELSDLFLFISLLCSVMYERSITANLCDATHKCRNRSMANKSLYFSVFSCTCLLLLFTFHDNYSDNWNHSIRDIDSVRIAHILLNFCHTTTCTCI